MKILSLIFLFLLACAAARAAALERDLGMGLIYRRIHALPADLPADDSIGRHACVLDLRFAQGDTAAATALAGWLKFHAGRKTPVFVLANSRTSPSLLAPFASQTGMPGLVVIGPKGSAFEPDIAVPVAAETDRRAYEALEKGATVESLTVDSREKSRYDEAMLEREHLPDSALADDPDKDKPEQPPPLLDILLQRAIQLHRALLALKRL